MSISMTPSALRQASDMCSRAAEIRTWACQPMRAPTRASAARAEEPKTHILRGVRLRRAPGGADGPGAGAVWSDRSGWFMAVYRS
jgi:hypothetical protein